MRGSRISLALIATASTVFAQGAVEEAAAETSEAVEATGEATEVAAVEATGEAAVETTTEEVVEASPPPPALESSTVATGDEASTAVEDDEILPLKVRLNGYYRARYNWIEGIPGPGSSTASFGTMRLRLEPKVEYGPNPELFIARLHITIDGLDNVVFGDNARINNVPILATAQSATDINGFDLNDTLVLKRAWIEFLVPFGQLRIGRMESNFGTGLLTHNGNDLAEWGDYEVGETFDRILFVTRPLSVANFFIKGDARPTPLIYVFGYDRLSQDPVTDPTATANPPTPSYAPYFSTDDQRSTAPFEYVSGQTERASEIINALAWWDKEFGNAENDELFIGGYAVYRFQPLTKTRLMLLDFGWRVAYTLGANKLTLKAEGDFCHDSRKERGASVYIWLSSGPLQQGYCRTLQCDESGWFGRRGRLGGAARSGVFVWR